jgi:hypothetical protein
MTRNLLVAVMAVSIMVEKAGACPLLATSSIW